MDYMHQETHNQLLANYTALKKQLGSQPESLTEVKRAIPALEKALSEGTRASYIKAYLLWPIWRGINNDVSDQCEIAKLICDINNDLFAILNNAFKDQRRA